MTDLQTLDISKISFNAGLFVKELLARKIDVSYVGDTQIMLARYMDHHELLFDVFNSLLAYPEGWIVNDKYYTKLFLQYSNIPVNRGKILHFKDIENFHAQAKEIGYPLVLKPTIGSHGDDVYVNIKNDEELASILKHIQRRGPGNGYLLMENYFPSQEYRVFVTRDNFFAAVHRSPASVLGDGKSTIGQLIERENKRRMNPRVNCLCEITIDEIAMRFITSQGITLEDIPKNNQEVFVRENSNVSTGGNCIDVTDTVHHSVRTAAFEILQKFPHASYLGIDLLCSDITQEINKESYRVCELNSAPGLSLHMMPASGQSRNVAGALIDLLFPETKNT